MSAKVVLEPLEAEDLVAALSLAEDWLRRARAETLEDLAEFLAPRPPGVLVGVLGDAVSLLLARLEQAGGRGETP